MATKTIVDLDDELGLMQVEPTHYKTIHMLGKDWTLVCDLNSFAMAQLAGGDAGGLSQFIVGLIDPAQQEEFAQTLGAIKGLSGEKLGTLLAKLIEVAGERPTPGHSPSLTMVKPKTSTRKSAAR